MRRRAIVVVAVPSQLRKLGHDIYAALDRRPKKADSAPEGIIEEPAQTYPDETPFTLSRLVHVVETEDVVFATGREILMPDARAESDSSSLLTAQHARLTGLDALAAVLRHAAFHPGERLCVFGHTDTVGSADDNLVLSDARATNVLHALRGDAEAWAAHCDAHFEVADYQRVLAWIARTRGWNTDPGPIDNDFGSLTRTARNNFRERMNDEYGTALELGTKQSPADWEAYFTLYDEALAERLEGSLDDLARIRGELEFTDPAAIGCGEAFPAAQPDQNNLASKTNRRVDLVFFAEDELPDELPGDPPGHPLYGTKDYRAKYLPLDPSTADFPVRLRLVDEGEPIAGETWRVERGGELVAQGKTDGDGLVRATLPRDASDLVLRVPALGRSFALDVASLPTLPGLAGIQGRLVNLGYPCSLDGELDDSTRDALVAFQHDHGLPATGEADGATVSALRDAHLS